MRVISVLQHCICHLFACVIENGERTGASKRPCYRCFFLFAQSLSTSVWQCWKEKKEWAIRASIVSWWPLSNCDREFENSWNGLDYIYKWHEGPDNILSFAMNLKKKLTRIHNFEIAHTYMRLLDSINTYIMCSVCVKTKKKVKHVGIRRYTPIVIGRYLRTTLSTCVILHHNASQIIVQIQRIVIQLIWVNNCNSLSCLLMLS